jgi:DNA-binding MarR family transcriptional regulator
MTAAARWLTNEQLRAWKGLSLMQLQLQARLSSGLAEHSLSYQDYLVLASLSDQPDGRRRVVELSDELGWEKSRLSHHITRMCQRGLLTKAPCLSDQRGIFVILSEAGRDVLQRAAPGHVRDVHHYFFDRLSREQVATLSSIADEVLVNLAETRDSAHWSTEPRDTERAPS